jgi:hypothetical protein
MSHIQVCAACGAKVHECNATHCSVCQHPLPNDLDRSRVATVTRIAGYSRRLLFANVPSVVGIAVMDLPQSLSTLNLLVLQLLVQFYFNGRVAEQRRSRSTGNSEATAALFNRSLGRDLLAFAGSAIVVFVSYAYLVQSMLSPK